MIKKLQSKFQKSVQEANEYAAIEKKIRSKFDDEALRPTRLPGAAAMDMSGRAASARSRAAEELGTTPAKVKKPTSLKKKLK